jgi:S-adenosylmethionine synthetase
MTRTQIAEYVLPGHPDKLSDAIADALVEETARKEKRGLCGVEVAVHRSSVFVTGRIACDGAEEIDVPRLVRSVYASAGYSNDWHPEPSALEVTADLCLGPLGDGEAEFRGSADDQSIVTGYAIDLPGTNYLPLEHWLAWRLAGALERLGRSRPELRCGPDGKVLVAVEESGGSSRLSAFSTSLQQAQDGCALELHRAVFELVRDELKSVAQVISDFVPDVPDQFLVNGAGEFSVGGPAGDDGLSGKKLVVDCYGPRVPIGGGALSGKDFYKVDRSGAIIARRLAKAVVMTGAARECHSTLAFSPGATEGQIVSLRDHDGKALEARRWCKLADLSLAGAGDRYSGVVPLVDVARYGHFTREWLPWERRGWV